MKKRDRPIRIASFILIRASCNHVQDRLILVVNSYLHRVTCNTNFVPVLKSGRSIVYRVKLLLAPDRSDMVLIIDEDFQMQCNQIKLPLVNHIITKVAWQSLAKAIICHSSDKYVQRSYTVPGNLKSPRCAKRNDDGWSERLVIGKRRKAIV